MVEKKLAKNTRIEGNENVHIRWLFGGCYIETKARVRNGEKLFWFKINDAYTGTFVCDMWCTSFRLGMRMAKKYADEYLDYTADETHTDSEKNVLVQGMLFGTDGE